LRRPPRLTGYTITFLRQRVTRRAVGAGCGVGSARLSGRRVLPSARIVWTSEELRAGGWVSAETVEVGDGRTLAFEASGEEPCMTTSLTPMETTATSVPAGAAESSRAITPVVVS